MPTSLAMRPHRASLSWPTRYFWVGGVKRYMAPPRRPGRGPAHHGRTPDSGSRGERGRGLEADDRLVAVDLVVEVGLPADPAEPLEAVRDRGDHRGGVGDDGLAERLTAHDEAAEDVGGGGAVVVRGAEHRRGGDEAHTLELAELAVPDVALAGAVLVRDTPRTGPGLLAEVVDHVRVQHADVGGIGAVLDLVRAQLGDGLADVGGAEVVRAGDSRGGRTALGALHLGAGASRGLDEVVQGVLAVRGHRGGDHRV